jgi:hypothetical protein
MEDNLSELLAVINGNGVEANKPIVKRDNDGGVMQEIEMERLRLAGEFAELTRHPDAEKVTIEIDAGYKILKQTIREFAQANIEMLDLVKDTPIEGGVERIRKVWNEFFRDVRQNLERARGLLSENNPSLPDESISVWLDFLISNFKDIKWRDEAPKEMRDRAFQLIVYFDKMKRQRKTRAEFRALIDKGFEVLNSMRTRLGLEPF